MHIGVITNPRSRKNRHHPGRAHQLKQILGEMGEVHTTDSVDSIKPVVREFLRKRARYWVADGGDGALHWMLNKGMEVLEEDEFAGMALPFPLVPTKGGTIDFVANNVGIEGTAETILAKLKRSIEQDQRIEEVEVDSMLIEGIEVTEDGEARFRTYGFACAAGGVGQRFFQKYYADKDPTPRTIMKVVARALASLPVAMSPLRHVRGLPQGMRTYASDLFKPAQARVTMDGMMLPGTEYTGIHVASMSINLGNVFRFFTKAEQPGMMHALLGSPSPVTVVMNLPRMTQGKELRGRALIDRPCRELTLEAVGDELLAPVIDGEYYRNLRKVSFKLGPRVRIPKVVADTSKIQRRSA
jgi:diacylglycerol kinase family enzyme